MAHTCGWKTLLIYVGLVLVSFVVGERNMRYDAGGNNLVPQRVATCHSLFAKGVNKISLLLLFYYSKVYFCLTGDGYG